MPYDIIGDIHGHAHELRALLERMGYRERDGAYRHPDRTALFVGDFIDRGPDQLDTIDVVRRMLDAGSARAVMGNHELNAIAWHTPDPESDGEFMRSHFSPQWGDKNRTQHAAFIAAVDGKPALHRELIDWFLTLPLWLDLPELRVVHACWHPEHMQALAPRLTSDRRIAPELLIDIARRGRREYAAAECLTKGLEIPLPEGHSFHDKDGHKRGEARLRWWDASAVTYRDAAIVPSELRERLPQIPIPESSRIIDTDPRPTFIGHYWKRGVPAPDSERVACVDYSAGKGDALVAYRWDGEHKLSAEKFVGSRGPFA